MSGLSVKVIGTAVAYAERAVKVVACIDEATIIEFAAMEDDEAAALALGARLCTAAAVDLLEDLDLFLEHADDDVEGGE